MNFTVEILTAAAGIALVYFVFRALFLMFAVKELNGAELVKRKPAAIEVYAKAESLEYYARLALAAAKGTTAVVVYIQKESEESSDMLDTVIKLRREHKNLSYRLI